MRVIKFCEQNIRRTDSCHTLEVLEQEYDDLVKIFVTDCFRRCLRCRIKPFCRIQLETIEGDDAHDLLNKIQQHLDRIVHM